jgi:hypothetical protein
VKGEYDQLAAVLKSCGIVASHYDANNMAQSINNGVKKSGEYFNRAYNQFQQSGKVDYTKLDSSGQECQSVTTAPNPSLVSVFDGAAEEALEQPAAAFEPEPFADIVVESSPPAEPAPVEEKKTLSIFEEEEDALQLAEDILREKEVDSSIMEKKEVIEQPAAELGIKAPLEEPKVVVQAAPAEIKAELAAIQPAANTEEMARKMAEEMFRKMAADQQVQQQKLQQQLAEQQQMMMKLMQQQAAAQQAAAAQPRPAPQPVEQPRQQKPQQTFAYPSRSAPSQSSAFREVPVDKNRPKPTLTKAEEAATDITKWFNFSKR